VWVYVGHGSEVPQPGDLVRRQIGLQPVIMIRGDDGQIRVFFNRCRHRGNLVCQREHATVDVLTCPYHGWTYALDGKLLKTTSCKGIQNFSVSGHGLKKIHVAEMGPFLFVHLGNDQSEASIQFEEFMKAHTKLYERDYLNLKFIRKTEYIVNCNWKVYVDNYIDGNYHIPYVHPGLDSQVNADEYKLIPYKNWSFQSVPGLKSQQDKYLKERVGEKGAIYCFMFPTLGINRYGDLMDSNHLIPLAVDKTLIIFEWYYVEKENEGNREMIEKLLKDGNQVQVEDESICERVQKGIRSHGFTQGRYAPSVEPGVKHFHTWYHENYKQKLKSLADVM